MNRGLPLRLAAALLAGAAAVYGETSAPLGYQLTEQRPIRNDISGGSCSLLHFEGSTVGWVAELQAASVGLIFRRCLYEEEDDSPPDWGYPSSEVYLLKPSASAAPVDLPGVGWMSTVKVCDRYLAYRQQRPERQVAIADLASMAVLVREPMFKPPCQCDVPPPSPVWAEDCGAVEFPDDEIRLINPAVAKGESVGAKPDPAP